VGRLAGRHREGIRLTREIGFDTIDIFADPLDIDVRERRLIRDTCRTPACRWSRWSAAHWDRRLQRPVRRFHVERAKRHLDFGYELGARNLLLVLGEYIWSRRSSRRRTSGLGPWRPSGRWASMPVCWDGDCSGARAVPALLDQQHSQDGEVPD